MHMKMNMKIRADNHENSAPIRVLCDQVRYINLLVVVVVVKHTK